MSRTIVFIIFILAFQGIITSVVLLLKENVRRTHIKYIVLLLLFISLFLLGKNLYWVPFYREHPHFIFSVISFPLLFGPFLYLYMVPGGSNKYLFLHFVPFLVLFALHIPFYLMSAEEKVNFLEEMILTTRVNARFFIYRAAMFLQVIVYSILIWRKPIKPDEPKRKAWYKTLLFLFAGFGLAYLAQMIVFGFFNNISTIATYFAIFMAIMASWILLFVTKILLVPELLKWRPKYARSRMSPELKNELTARLETIMNEEALFLNKDLRLVDLAHKSGLSEHQLSQVLSESLQMNFFEFVNSYRIENAKEFLVAEKYRNYTIDAIAQEVGFKSKSTFYDAFRKFVGTTPSAYRKAH